LGEVNGNDRSSGAPDPDAGGDQADTTSREAHAVERLARFLDPSDLEIVLSALLEHSSDLIIVCDHEAKPIAVNLAYARLMEEALGITVRAGVKPYELLEDPERIAWWDSLHRRVLGGESFRVDVEHDFPERGRRVFELTYTPILSNGEVIGFSGIGRDMTERVRLEKSLEESELQHRALLESAADVVYALDASGRYFYANERLADSQAIPAADFIGKTIEEIFPAEVARRFRANVDAVLESGERLVIPAERVVTARGESIVTSTISPVKDDDGRVWAVVGVSSDVTDLRRAQEERRRLERQLLRAQRLEGLSMLAGGIAHDFNNILVGVLANADLLLRSLDPGDPNRDRARSIESAARQAADLARQMLVYAGRGQVQVSRQNLNDLIRDTTGILEAAMAKGAHVTYELDDDLPAIHADPSQIRQLVMNLVINASEAIGDDRGSIRIQTKAVDCADASPEDPPVFCGVKAGRCALLVVSDSGCGMSEDVIPKIFDPFFSTKFQGRGLGLAAVAGVVKGHGGNIWVESAPEVGSSFNVLLPAAEEVAAVADQAPVADSGVLAGKRLLLVDDEPHVRSVGKEMAELLGMTVTLAEDGDIALARYTEDPDSFDVVLLDLTMPGMGGIETLGRLRAIRSSVSVILTSGLGSRAAAPEAGVADPPVFLDKPYRLEDLEAALVYAVAGCDGE